jgi:hypothetical protein
MATCNRFALCFHCLVASLKGKKYGYNPGILRLATPSLLPPILVFLSNSTRWFRVILHISYFEHGLAL